MEVIIVAVVVVSSWFCGFASTQVGNIVFCLCPNKWWVEAGMPRQFFFYSLRLTNSISRSYAVLASEGALQSPSNAVEVCILVTLIYFIFSFIFLRGSCWESGFFPLLGRGSPKLGPSTTCVHAYIYIYICIYLTEAWLYTSTRIHTPRDILK